MQQSSTDRQSNTCGSEAEAETGSRVQDPESTAILFPGMGATTFADLGRFLVFDRYARSRVAEADEVLGTSLLAGFRDQGDGYGVLSQVAFVVASIALADRVDEELGVRADMCVGASFGQRPLLTYVGALEFSELIRLTVDLAERELAYFAHEPEDLVTQCFLRVPEEEFRTVMDEFRSKGEWVDVSGYLDRGGYLVSLRARLLEDLIDAVRAIGGYKMQAIHPPVHAKRFQPLRDKVESEVVSKYGFRQATIPVISDHDGRVVKTATEVRGLLLEGFDHAIRWPVAVKALREHGIRKLYVVGPDLLFHKLDCTVSNFEVVPVTHKTALATAGMRQQAGWPVSL